MKFVKDNPWNCLEDTQVVEEGFNYCEDLMVDCSEDVTTTFSKSDDNLLVMVASKLTMTSSDGKQKKK